MHPVYEAQEDSYLLIDCLPKNLSGKKVLEIGSGSGVVSVAAAKRGGEVIAVDINPAAVQATQELAEEKKVEIKCIESNRFEKVKGKTFDYILCNPPYLPNEPKDPDIALDGGPEGFEYIAKFLSEAKEHLNENGKILLLFSSHSKIDKVAEHISKHNFVSKTLASKHVGFFEELYLVELMNAQEKKIVGTRKEMNIKNKEFLAKGKRGYVYIGEFDGKKVLIKEHNPEADIDTIGHEALMNEKLNKIHVGPQFIAYENKQLIREYVDGERIEDFFEHCTNKEAKNVLKEVLFQCKRMDDIGINKFEMTHPYKHILVSKNKGNSEQKTSGLQVTMIDFERCKHTRKPKNVTQFCQYIGRIQPLLAKIGVLVSEEEIRELGKEYKQEGYDEKIFEKLIKVFS